MMSMECLRLRSCVCAMFILVAGTQVVAEPAVPVGLPVLGPLERPARPLVLIFQPHHVQMANPFATGLVGGTMDSISDGRYGSASKRTGEAIRAAAPNLDVASEIRTAFGCGQAGSLCTEMVVSDKWSDEALASLLQSRQWSTARVMSFWWDQEDRRLGSHAALREVRLDGDKLGSKRPVFAVYFITAPRVAKSGAKQNGGPIPHSDEWEVGAALPREDALRTAIAALEPMLQMALSWGVNNDAVSRSRIIGTKPLRRYRKEGIECYGLTLCNQAFDSVVDDRVWSWRDIAQAPEIKSYVLEMQSRSRVDP